MFYNLKYSLVIFFVLFSQTALAEKIPADLAKWNDWVKYQQEFRDCPSLNGSSSELKVNHLCAWPGRLQLKVNDTHADFIQSWELLDESRVPLPGNTDYWPQNVSVNNSKMVVMEDNGLPYIQLEKGKYSISGQFEWSKRPESLRVPESVALFDVLVNNQAQAFVLVESNNLWLGSENQQQVKEKDFLKLWVNRLIQDDHPMRMTVALQVEVSGRAREQKLTNFSPSLYQLMAVKADLNTRIDNRGDLWVQLKPGSHEIRLEFKIHGFPEQLTFGEIGEDWPAQEIWAYQNNERLRATQIEGVEAIDAEQGFVAEWKNFPHYVLNQNQALVINERHRGLTHSGDSLTLMRNMWLSFDDSTFYFFDDIQGTKTHDWRVSTLENFHLNQLSNHDQPRLITYDEKHRTGAEIRTSNIAIRAGGEVAHDAMHHASGWDIKFANTQVTLNVPPGRKVVNISGADFSSGDWMGRWDLIDFFFVLVTVALVFRFFGILPSAFALITLTLGYHEMNMPTFWWFNFVVATALAKNINLEKLAKGLAVYQWVSVALLMFAMLPFLAQQIRVVLYPQLEMSQTLKQGEGLFYDSLASSPMPAKPEITVEESVVSSRSAQAVKEAAQKVVITGSRIRRTDLDSGYDAGAVIQAGQGRPEWRWQVVQYGWNGPVAGDEKVHIRILSNFWVRLLRIALIIFSLLWLLSIFDKNVASLSRLKGWFQPQSPKEKNTTAGSNTPALFFVAGLSLLMGAFTCQPVKATDFPSEQMLQELQKRIYPQTKCEPDCITLADAKLKVDGLDLELALEYHSGNNKAGLLPDSKDWRVNRIRLNGKKLEHVWRNSRGPWVSLPQGISQVIINASLKDKSELAIQFAEKPHFFSAVIQGWEISGVSQNQLISDAIQLTRLQQNTNNSEKIKPGDEALEPDSQEQSISELFTLQRTFTFGSQWQLTTRVERLAPKVGSLTAKVPLLAYEQPLELTENIKQGFMQVVIPSGTDEQTWNSSLSGAEQFNLVALDDPAFSEIWEIVVFPNWNIQISGVPQVMPQWLDPEDTWLYQYYPRAGEQLSFTLNKPPAVEGASVAINAVDQNYTISKRKTSNALNIQYRATRAEQLLLNIDSAEVKRLSHDGKAVSLSAVDGVLAISLKPGEHSIALQLESAQEIDSSLHFSGVKLNQPFSNLSTQVSVPESRWLIFASGPGYGPAIIYWGELFFFLLLAIGLSRLSFSPLKYWQWLVLGLGMSTYSWPAMGWVSVWLLASQWGRQNTQTLESYPVLRSWLIVLSTIAAVIALVTAVPFGLLQSPDMAVIGNGSDNQSLSWFLDRGQEMLGELELITLPLWIYKGLMLLWATWLSFSLIKWLSWIWNDLANAKFSR